MKRVLMLLGSGVLFVPFVLPLVSSMASSGGQGAALAPSGPFAVAGYLVASPTGSFGDAPQGSLGGPGIPVPGVRTWLRSGTAALTPAVRTDLSGRFTFPPRQKPGRYFVCWKTPGFVSGCSKAFSVSQHMNVGAVRIAVAKPAGTRTFYGKVAFADGSLTYMNEPLFNVNSFAIVSHVVPKGRFAYVNTAGEYLLPAVPVAGRKVRLRASIENAARNVTAVVTALPYRKVDFTMPNRPPTIEGIVGDAPGGKHWTANPGDTVKLTARGVDPDGNALAYRWLMPDGSSILPAAGGATVSHTLPNLPGRYDFEVVAYDARGGYAKERIKIVTQGVQFAGTVDATDAPAVAGAEVEINGATVKTDATGAFSMFVKESPRYVLNIRQRGYGLVSRIYDNGITGERWTLARATVATVDPTAPIDVVNVRRPGDCPGSLSEQARRQGKPKDCSPGIRVRIPANSLVDPAGNKPAGLVDVELTTVDLEMPNAMPGDFTAVDSSGSERFMESYGAGTVEIFAGGKELNLAPGASAEVIIPIPHSQLGAPTSPPATIPFLTYDEARGVWVQEGVASRSGNVYVGKVTHFTPINSDLLLNSPACVRIDATLMPTSFDLESTVTTSSGTTATRKDPITNQNQRFHIIYNLPTGASMKLKAFDTTGVSPVQLDLFTLASTGVPTLPATSTPEVAIDTGAAQSPWPPDLPPFPYAACKVTAELISYKLPNVLEQQFLFRLGSAFNLDKTTAADPGKIQLKAQDYYKTIDPQGKRLTLSAFKAANGYTGTSSTSEVQGFYANTADLGFGRDMNCRQNGADVACYVTNYGDRFSDDVADYKNAVDRNPAALVATVAMEYSQIENISGGTNEVQTLTITGAPTGGSFTLTFNGLPTAPIAQNATAAAVTTALEALPNIGAASVLGAGGPLPATAVTLTFQNGLGKDNVSQLIPTSSLTGGASPVATVTTPTLGVHPGFQLAGRVVKFYVFNNAGSRQTQADLDGFGNRPVPQLCMVCHGGKINVGSSAPGAPDWVPTNANTANLNSAFIPFDLKGFTFVPHVQAVTGITVSQGTQEPNFKQLNKDIVAATNPPPATLAVITAMYDDGTSAGASNQIPNFVLCKWRTILGTPGTSSGSPACTLDPVVATNQQSTYADVVRPSCQNCHISQSPATYDWTTAAKFKTSANLIGYAVCSAHYMPHSKVTHNNFWLSTNPPQPPILKAFLDAAQPGAGLNC